VLLLNESCPHDNNVSCFLQKRPVAKLLPTRRVSSSYSMPPCGFPC